MFLGPIIHGELLRISRQKRWFVLRAVLGGGVLLLFCSMYSSFSSEREMSQARLTAIGVEAYFVILVCQSIAIGLLAPLIVAGAIAEEKQRKTLLYLLASPMHSFEIVWGKLAARLVVILIPFVVALPMLTMFSLLGGIDPNIAFIVYAATITTALLEASIGILCSTLMKRGRDALIMTIFLVLLITVAPWLLAALFLAGSRTWAPFYFRLIDPWCGHFFYLTPFCLVGVPADTRAGATGIGTQDMVLARAVRMCLYQTAASLAVLAFATWRLRPIFARQDGQVKKERNRPQPGDLPARPSRPIGENPVLWKETIGARRSKFGRFIVWTVAVMMILGNLWPLANILPKVLHELLAYGYFRPTWGARSTLNAVIRVNLTPLFTLWLLMLGAAAATSVSREREDDTWISLVSTPLEASELLVAKIAGAFWTTRGLVYAMLAIIGFGVLTNALHPLGAFVACLQIAVFGSFMVAFGTVVSLRARTTMRAIMVVVCTFLGLTVAWPLIGSVVTNSAAVIMPPCFPALFGFALVDVSEVDSLYRLTHRWNAVDYRREFILAECLGVFGFAIVTTVLARLAFKLFDVLLDRPRRSIYRQEPAVPPAKFDAAVHR